MSEVCLKFAWRYGRLEVDSYDTIQSALSSAKAASDYGDEHLERIEQIIDGVVRGIYLMDDVYRLVPDPPYQPLKPRPYVLSVKVYDPEADKHRWAEYDRYETEKEALIWWGNLAAKVGDSRCQVVCRNQKVRSAPDQVVIGGS